MIDKDFLLDFVNSLKEEIDQNGYTFFEVATALAFFYFANRNIDIAVLETGLGGRLDSTNIVNPLISLITNISLEHTEHLGTTISQIAFEKAGIIKNGVPTITSVGDPEALQVIRNVCAERKSPLSLVNENSEVTIHKLLLDQSTFDYSSYKNLELNLAGRHQVINACLAISTIEKLKETGWEIKSKAVKNGLKDVNWPGRLEIFRKNPLILLDVAHNPAGTKTLVDTLEEFFPEKRIIFIFGVMADKDYPSMLKEICRKAKFILLTKPDYKRAADPELLEKVLTILSTPYEILPQVKQAYIFSLKNARSEDVICITGSHFTVGEFLS